MTLGPEYDLKKKVMSILVPCHSLEVLRLTEKIGDNLRNVSHVENLFLPFLQQGRGGHGTRVSIA